MKTAIIWCRTSTDKQEWETQKKDLLKVAAKDGFTERSGNLIIIGEQGASAIKMNELYQQEVNQLLNTIQTVPDVSTIYVWEISRLARNKVAFQQMEAAIIEKRIQLVSNVPSLKLFDEDEHGNVTDVNQGSEITFDLLITLAKQEMEIKKKRFSRGKERLAEQGKFNGGAIPYGYKVDPSDDNRIIIDEEVEAPIVREVFNLYEQGLSQMAIAKELYARGVKGRAVRHTKNITISLVHQILTNELLTGKEHKSKGSSFFRKYPPIISDEQFNRCRTIAEKNNKVLPKSRRVYYAHKLIECTECKRFFASTGYKGYYHCKDAYNYNKEYEGYEGVPKCTNRVCISVNIMDSLLWSLAIKYETFFIMNEARKTISSYKERIRVLKEKVKAIPGRLSTIDRELERLGEAYVDGTINKAKYELKKEEKRKRKHEILREKAEYLSNIEHINAMMAQATKALEKDASLKGFVNTWLTVDKIIKRVSNITDDQERSDIIHRHIEKVTVEKTTIVQSFGNHPEGKEVLAKRITVYPFSSEKEVFYFVPNDGKGGHMLKYQDNEKVSMYLEKVLSRMQGNKTIEQTPTMLPFEMKYLQRIKDEGKYRRRELARAKRESLENEAIDKLRKQGYISMKEMQQLSKLSYSSIYRAIKQERLVAKHQFKTWYVKETDFLEYLDKYKPQPRPEQKKDRVIPEQSIEIDEGQKS